MKILDLATLRAKAAESAAGESLALSGGCLRKALPAAEIRSVDGMPNTLRFILSTEDIDRAGDRIMASGWKLDSYIRNPVVLWCHEYHSPPVGKGSNLAIEGKTLVGDATFAVEEHEFNKLIFDLYKGGYMRAVSIGMEPLVYQRREGGDARSGIDFIEHELLEFSCVPVPMNPHALIQARAVGGLDTRPMRNWAERLHDEIEPERKGIKLRDGLYLSKTLIETLIRTSDDNEPTISIPEKIGVEELEEPEGEAEPDAEDAPATEGTPVTPPAEAEEAADDPAAEDAATEQPEKSAEPVHAYETMRQFLAGEFPGKTWNEETQQFEGKAFAEAFAECSAFYKAAGTPLPEQRFIDAEVLRNLPDSFVFDIETGVLSRIEDAERRKVAMLKWLDAATAGLGERVTKEALECHPAKSRIETLLAELKSAIQCEDAPKDERHDNPPPTKAAGFSASDVVAFMKGEGRIVLEEAIEQQIRAKIGKLD